MRLLALIIALLLGTSRCAQATPLFISGMDATGIDDGGHVIDSVEFVDRGTANANTQIVTTRVHDAANGGTDSSKHAAYANVASGANHGWYTLYQDLPALLALTVSVSVNVDVAPASSERTILTFYETGNPTPSTPGCFVTVNSSRQLSLYYGSSSNTWGTTSFANGALQVNACHNDPSFRCTTPANDCPTGASDACSVYYWAGLELTQIRNGGNVDCELRSEGTLILGGTLLAVAGGTVKQVGFGATDVSGTARLTAYFDDLVVDSSDRSDAATAPGYGFVAMKVPSTQGVSNDWKLDTNCTPTANPTTNRALCMDDYYVDSPYTYGWTSGTTGNPTGDGLQESAGSIPKSQSFPTFTPDVQLVKGQTATAAELVVVGKTSTSNGIREIASDMLLCPPCGDTCNTDAGACQYNTSVSCATDADCAGYCSAGVRTTCTTASDCCTSLPGPTTKITDTGYTCVGSLRCSTTNFVCATDTDCKQFGTPTQLHRFLVAKPNSAIPGASWSTAANWVGWTLRSTSTGNTQVTRVGAGLIYIRVKKNDLSSVEGMTLGDHNAVGTPCAADAECGGTCTGSKKCTVSGIACTVNGDCAGGADVCRNTCSLSGVACAADADCGGTSGTCDATSHRCTNGKDGLLTIAAIGDSTLYGTLTGICQGGTGGGIVQCSQQTYCNWDLVGQLDKPRGGCGSFRQCTGNTTKPCTTDADCDVGEGTCKYTGTCQPSATACDVACSSCTNRENEFNNNGGFRCSADADCQLGPTCDSGHCHANDDVTCTVNSDCDLGACRTTALGNHCVEACPGGGICPSARVGWQGPIGDKLRPDVLLQCGAGGEDIGEMFTNRFRGIMAGLGNSVTSCKAVTGTGHCLCANSGDCGGGTCGLVNNGVGICLTGSGNRATCLSSEDCAGTNPTCQFPLPDYAVGVEGYNDRFQGREFNLHYGHDPQCSLYVQNFASFAPPAMCPQIATGAGYKVAPTPCTQDSSCAGSSQCFGARTSTAPGPCEGVAITSLSGGGLACTGIAIPCGVDRDCNYNFFTSATAVGGAPYTGGGTGVCVGANAAVPQLKTGRCRPTGTVGTQDVCPTGYVVAGSPKMCRQTCANDDGRNGDTHCAYCTANTDCGPSGTCTANHCVGGCASGVCQGLCGAACDAVSCTTDLDCGGLTLTSRLGQPPLRKYRHEGGRCNPVSHKCYACGQAKCFAGGASEGPCSCASPADCGGGGACSAASVCTAGDATRVACRLSADCVKGQRCLSPRRALDDWQRHHRGLAPEVYGRMTRMVSAFSSTPPRIIPSGLPALGGLDQTGTIIPERDCDEGPSQQYAFDIGYNRSVGPDLVDNAGCSCAADADCGTHGLCRAGACLMGPTTRTACSRDADCAPRQRCHTFQAQRVIDFRNSTFDTNRFRLNYHTDQVHLVDAGATEAGNNIAGQLERLNVCVKRTSSGTAACECASNVDCGPGGTCDLTSGNETQGTCTSGPPTRTACAWNTDCAPGKRCAPPQKYCKLINGTFADTGCGNAATCPKLCMTATDCLSGQRCVRKRCDGNDTYCPATNDVCNPD